MMRIFRKRGTSRQAAWRRERSGSTRHLRFELFESGVMLSAWSGEAPAEPVGENQALAALAWEGEAPAEPVREVSWLEDHAPAFGLLGSIGTISGRERLGMLTGGAIQIHPLFGDDFVDIADSLKALHPLQPGGLPYFDGDFATWPRGDADTITNGFDPTNAAHHGSGTIVFVPPHDGGPWLVGPYHPESDDLNGPPRDTIKLMLSPMPADDSHKDTDFISIVAIGGPETPTVRPVLAADKPSDPGAERADAQLDGAKGRAQVFEMAGLLDRGVEPRADAPRGSIVASGLGQDALRQANPSAIVPHTEHGGATSTAAGILAACLPVAPLRTAPPSGGQLGVLAGTAGGVTAAGQFEAASADASQTAPAQGAPADGTAHATSASQIARPLEPAGGASVLPPDGVREVASSRIWPATACSSVAVLGAFLTYRHLSALRADQADKSAAVR